MTVIRRQPVAAPRWLCALREPERPRHRVLLLPHAGAGPYALGRLVAMLPESAEVLVAALPGREHRLAEPPRSRLADVLDGVQAELLDRAPLPTVVFGCSVGALLAVRIAERLPQSCSGVVVASQTPGGHERPVLYAEGERELLRIFTEAGDTPPAVLADDDIRASLLVRLQADLRLGAEAEWGFADIRLQVPVTVLGGLHDPLAPARHLHGWALHTTGECRVVMLSGGHFAYLARRHRDLVAAVLRDSMPHGALPGDGLPDQAVPDSAVPDRALPDGGGQLGAAALPHQIG